MTVLQQPVGPVLRLEIGALAVNNVALSVPDAPFGGIKNSGLGA